MASTFIPDPVDFFSVLRANEDVARGMPGAFEHVGLLNELRLAVARILFERVRDVEIPAGEWGSVNRIIAPGQVIITSNWDIFVEHYAGLLGIPLRLGGQPGDHYVTLIKLHGSVDWTHRDQRRATWPNSDFAALREIQNSNRTWTIPVAPEEVLRIRAVENMQRSWQFVKARTTKPLMITMSQGKSSDMQSIRSMWEDAYYALSAARHLSIIGYSMPNDDIEIRTLLRAGVARGASRASQPRGSGAQVTVINPETQVHVRIRTLVSRTADSDFRAFVAK